MQPSDRPLSCIDFVFVRDGVLFVFGWVLDRGPRVVAVTVRIGVAEWDASPRLLRFARPDVVAAHGSGLPEGRRECGFLVAVEVPEAANADRVGLSMRVEDGKTFSMEAPFSTAFEACTMEIVRRGAHLRALAGRLTREEATRLARAAGLSMGEMVEAGNGAAPVSLGLDLCFVPAPGFLLVAGWLAAPAGVVSAIAICRGEGDAALNGAVRFTTEAGPEGVRRFVTSAWIGAEAATALWLVPRMAGGARRRLELEPGNAPGIEAFAGFVPESDINTRLMVLEEIALCLGEAAASLGAPWRRLVAALPAALHEPFPGMRLCVDSALRAGSQGVVLTGWACSGSEEVAVFCRTPSGHAVEISRDWVRHPREDVRRPLHKEGVFLQHDALGFCCFVRVKVAPEDQAFYIEARRADGTGARMRVVLSPAMRDPVGMIRPILAGIWSGHRELRRLLDAHVGPAVAAVWKERPRPAPQVSVTEHGLVPDAAACSVVVPIHGRFDFIEHQLNAFADDPAMRGQELIYVIDDPAIHDEARLACQEFWAFYRVPFRLVYAGRNGGYAQATNLGASLARGEHLLLLNSDVLPDRPGWLPVLLEAYRALPSAGAVAPKLLYEDGSLQHAGMRFARHPGWGGMWINEHPGKGLPDLGDPAPRAVPAVTGACLLIRRELYWRVGGLSEEYIIGDFEDSDLCLKLLAEGRRNWVVPSVVLFHLERQSQDRIGAEWRANLSLYNCWAHMQRWNCWAHMQRWDAAISLLAEGGGCAS